MEYLGKPKNSHVPSIGAWVSAVKAWLRHRPTLHFHLAQHASIFGRVGDLMPSNRQRWLCQARRGPMVSGVPGAMLLIRGLVRPSAQD